MVSLALVLEAPPLTNTVNSDGIAEGVNGVGCAKVGLHETWNGVWKGAPGRAGGGLTGTRAAQWEL